MFVCVWKFRFLLDWAPRPLSDAIVVKAGREGFLSLEQSGGRRDPWEIFKGGRGQDFFASHSDYLLRTAMLAGLSRKDPWRLSPTLATQTGMTDQWLEVQGLLPVKELWGTSSIVRPRPNNL